MRILQFLCPQELPANQLKLLMLSQINTWSRLSRLSMDINYITDSFTMEVWREHTVTKGLWWVDYDSLYKNLGDDGRKIADQMLGTGPFQGILRMAPLLQSMPQMRLELIDVVDLIGAGYLTAKDLEHV